MSSVAKIARRCPRLPLGKQIFCRSITKPAWFPPIEEKKSPVIFVVSILKHIFPLFFHAFQYEHGVHRSNAEELVNKVPVIEVDGLVAVCDGGGGALGHPLEYIQLHLANKKVNVCKYCGLRFTAKGHH